MERLRHLAPATRALLIAALALCLGVRVLTPAGFMPAVERGALTIVVCPDGDGAGLARMAVGVPAMAMPHVATSQGHDDHHGNGETPFHHQSCPYAAAASLAGLVGNVAVVLAVLLIPLLVPRARSLPALRRAAARERPPLRGPPIFA